MKIQNIAIVLVCLTLVVGAGCTRQKTGVIRLAYVFEHFEGATLAAKELAKASDNFENTLDSLKNRIDRLTPERAEEAEYLRRTMYELNQKAGYSYEKLNNELSQGVQNQIDTYLQIYRKENGYDLLISQYQSVGAIAADEKLDITEHFTKALNNYYFHE
jgi:Skp family chaperone for outer membrane proteins